MSKRVSHSKMLRKKVHNCGNGFRGEVVKARGIAFCGFCGKEFRNK